MKKAIVFFVILMFLSPAADACVGKTLIVGVTKTTEGKVLGQILSTLVNERTGTTVEVYFYDDLEGIYDAVKEKVVDISIENTASAMNYLNMPEEKDAKIAYKKVKATYEQEKGLIWLKPFGFKKSSESGISSYTATILRTEILNNFPALPRLFNKLGSKINDSAYTKMIKSVESGKEPKSVAKDFLKSKKLI